MMGAAPGDRAGESGDHSESSIRDVLHICTEGASERLSSHGMAAITAAPTLLQVTISLPFSLLSLLLLFLLMPFL